MMKTNRSAILAALATGMVLSVGADQLTIPMTETPRVVTDGVFSKDEYAVSSMFGGLVHKEKKRMVARDGDIYLTADKEALHVAAQWSVEGSETDGGFVTQAKQDGGPVYYDDCIEIFIGGEGGAETNVYQILLNAANARFESHAINGKVVKDGWKSGAKTAARVSSGFWTSEAAIPWASLKGVDPKRFRFNLARNFVRAGLGYSSLTGQGDVYLADKMIRVTSREGFGGVKVFGFDTSLIAGRLKATCECPQKHYFTASVHQNGKLLVRNDPEKETSLPQNDHWKFATAEVSADGFGKVYHRIFLPFEGGGMLAGGPVTEKRAVAGVGYSFTRFYPGADKVSVILTGAPKNAKIMAEVKSPDGQAFGGAMELLADGSFKALVKLPAEKTRKAGVWTGAFVIDGKRHEEGFAFEEKKFPWQRNKLGYSNKVLEPFTPIEFKDRTLKTVLREHTVSDAGLVSQVKALGEEILAGPLAFELEAKGVRHVFKQTDWKVFENKAHRVLTQAVGTIGPFRMKLTTAWDYDGFADVSVRLSPMSDERTLDRLTLKAPLKAEHASLFHAMVDMTRGNPAGLVPTGDGKVWDSSELKRKKSPQGLPWIPGEFCPYLWLGAEERGISLLFDSPKGYDLEDGKPMLRIVRRGDTVTAEADVMSRAHEVAEPVEFAFAFEVTPVKPRMPGWKKWVYDFGTRLPGLVHVNPIENASSFGLYPEGFRHLPNDTNKWAYARAYRKAMRERRLDPAVLEDIQTKLHEEYLAWGNAHSDKYEHSYHRGVKRFADFGRMYNWDNLTRGAMTTDKAAPYSCPSIVGLGEPGYAYSKAEWATLVPYHDGMSDRIFLRQSTVDYLVWCYRELLKQGADGINFDEMYVVPQSNPDLSEVRDYKGRCIPEMGIIAGRNMFKRLAYIQDEMGLKDRILVPHLTNTMIIPEFAFCTISLAWEYDISGNFVDQFPLDYIRAHSTGRQAGLAPAVLVLYKDPLRGKIPEKEFCVRRNRSFRTAMGLCVQHELSPVHRYWGDFSEQFYARYVLWAFGTHRDDCTFIPYWTKGKPFRVTDEKDVRAAKSTAPAPSFETMGNIVPAAPSSFVVGAYRRGSSTLFMVTNLGRAGKTTLTYDAKKLGIAPGAVLTDAMTGEAFPDGTFTVPECEYRFLFAGPAEFGATLIPPEPDWGYIIK